MDQVKKTSPKVPESIIKLYAKYQNKKDLQTYQVKGTTFEIDCNYEILDHVGKGSYGVVVAAKDRSLPSSNQLVAIKKIQKAFEHKLFTKRTLRELKILRVLKHANIASISKLLLPSSRETFEDLYVIYELMETDLKTIIRSPQILTEEHVQFFLYQILRGLKYIHSAGILHRDLKPGNLLVNTNCDLKICDFGLARANIPGLTSTQNNQMTDYVITRWYRAPEMLLQWSRRYSNYTSAVDMWSVGCIFGEMLKRKTLFAGNDTAEQMKLIVEFLGTPSEEEIAAIPSLKTQRFIRKLQKRKPIKFESYFKGASVSALDLLKKMLIFDPKKRIGIQDALKHPFLESFHLEEDEATTDPVSFIDFEFEEYSLSIEQMKDLIYEEILLYHYEDFKKEYDRKKSLGLSVMQHIIRNSEIAKIDESSSEEVDSEEDFSSSSSEVQSPLNSI